MWYDERHKAASTHASALNGPKDTRTHTVQFLTPKLGAGQQNQAMLNLVLLRLDQSHTTAV
jgi:hypothetical protein